MNRETAAKGTEGEKSRRCAVIKIDFNCRFVYIDEYAERLFGLPSENLFGRSMKDFLDEESYTLLLSVLPSQNHYESFFEATRLTLIDARGDRHELDIIISLNFIAGNPANYQIIFSPLNERVPNEQSASEYGEIPHLLISYLSMIEKDVDWQKLCGLFMAVENILQAGIYRLHHDDLELLAQNYHKAPSGIRIDFGKRNKNFFDAAVKNYPYVESKLINAKKNDDSTAVNIVDSGFPLSHNGQCWGLLRVIYKDGSTENRDRLNEIAAFLGNALYMYAVELSVPRLEAEAV